MPNTCIYFLNQTLEKVFQTHPRINNSKLYFKTTIKIVHGFEIGKVGFLVWFIWSRIWMCTLRVSKWKFEGRLYLWVVMEYRIALAEWLKKLKHSIVYNAISMLFQIPIIYIWNDPICCRPIVGSSGLSREISWGMCKLTRTLTYICLKCPIELLLFSCFCLPSFFWEFAFRIQAKQWCNCLIATTY